MILIRFSRIKQSAYQLLTRGSNQEQKKLLMLVVACCYMYRLLTSFVYSTKLLTTMYFQSLALFVPIVFAQRCVSYKQLQKENNQLMVVPYYLLVDVSLKLYFIYVFSQMHRNTPREREKEPIICSIFYCLFAPCNIIINH